MLVKVLLKLRAIRAYYVTTPVERLLAAHCARRQPRTDENTSLLALQCVEDHLYLGTFGEIVAALRARTPLRVEQYVFRSLRHGESAGLRGWLWTRLAVNRFSDQKWERLYASFCDGIAVRSAAWLSPFAELRIWRQARAILRGYRDKDQFVALSVNGVQIGDLVIDSYIRYRPWPEFRPRDPYAARVLRQALRDVEKAFNYFRSRQPRVFLTSYSCYVQHGVPVRVAVALGVEVISFGNYQKMAKPLSIEDTTHLSEHWNYRRHFEALPAHEQAQLLDEANDRLRGRMQGEIDNAIGYMRKSAYDVRNCDVPDVKDAVVIYLPDFYDGIHVYRWSVFHDFWEWTRFTIETLEKASIPFWIKGHPNVAPDSVFVYDMIRMRYPQARFLPPGVTTAQLARAGMACGASPRGTVLSELPYLGVPVLAGGDHPHATFDLQEPARSIAEYQRRLLQAQFLPRDPETMRRNACIFYAMHNLCFDADQVALRDLWLDLRGRTMTLSPEDPDGIVRGFQHMGRMPHFLRQIEEWAAILRQAPDPANASGARRAA